MNGILKEEYLKHNKPENKEQAGQLLDKAINLYNQRRPHFSIALLTPDLVHEKELPTEKLWKNYYHKNTNIVNVSQDNIKPVNT